ncbi:hypothetical protein ACWEVP_41340 [Amycolatopsis sp. NPDC003865]
MQLALDAAQVTETVKWTEIVESLGTVAGATGTLLTLVFVALQLKRQAESLRDQRDASVRSLDAVSKQIAAQAEQTSYVAEQTRLQTTQTTYVAEQTAILAKSNKSLLYQNVVREMQNLTTVFLNDPGLWTYFYEDTLPSDSEELGLKVRIVSEMFVDLMAFTLNTDVFFDEDNRGSWIVYFEYIASKSRAIQDYWTEHGEWYEPVVRKVLDPVVAAAVAARTAPPAPELASDALQDVDEEARIGMLRVLTLVDIGQSISKAVRARLTGTVQRPPEQEHRQAAG